VTYAANFGNEHLFGDITDVEAEMIPDHDILTAGFPCQQFSKAGTQQGFDADLLFFDVVRVLIAKKPIAFMLENVENILHIDDGNTVIEIIKQLEAIGYSV
jgi:DNA (cytosine-5)-methyltransferase 1